MPQYMSANRAYLGKTVNLLTDVLGSPVPAQIQNGPPDFLINSLADLPPAVGGVITLPAGSYYFAQSLALGGDRLEVAAGAEVYLVGELGKTISGSGGNLLTLTTGTAWVENLDLSDPVCVYLNGAGGRATLLGCRLTTTGTASIVAGAFQGVSILGGEWVDGVGGADGLQVAGAISRILANGVEAYGAFGNFVRRTGGAQGQCTLLGCTANSNGGVNWAAANIPANGLLVVACALFGVAPFTGHTPATARVNYKACVTTASLLTETAIVP